jgi:hypothetical protein
MASLLGGLHFQRHRVRPQALVLEPRISAAVTGTGKSSVFRHAVPRAGFSYVLAESGLGLPDGIQRREIGGRILTFFGIRFSMPVSHALAAIASQAALAVRPAAAPPLPTRSPRGPLDAPAPGGRVFICQSAPHAMGGKNHFMNVESALPAVPSPARSWKSVSCDSSTSLAGRPLV